MANNNGSGKSLESWIWDAACSIRGAKDAPKYKDYILPLIFTKRLCDVFDDELVVGLGEPERFLARADLLRDAVQLVIEDVAQALGEDEGEDVILVFRRILGTANGAGGVPDPGFKGFFFFLSHL